MAQKAPHQSFKKKKKKKHRSRAKQWRMPRVIGRFPSAASGKQKEKGSARIQTKNRPSCRVFLSSCLHDLRSAVYLPRQEINRVLHRGDTHTKRSGQGEELGWISDWRYHPIERERGREKRSVWKLNFNGVSMSLRMEALCWGKRKNNDLCIWLSRRKEEKKKCLLYGMNPSICRLHPKLELLFPDKRA